MRLPMPHRSVTGRGPMTAIQFADDSRNTLSVDAFAKPVAIFARSLVSPMPTAQVSRVWARTRALTLLGQTLGIGDAGPEHRLVPAPDLDGMTERAQRRHHLGAGRVVGGMVRGQEHRLRALPVRPRQRHPGVHPEGPCLVRRGGHHLPWSGGISVAADHHRQPAQLRAATDLHRRQERVQVDVQDPRFGIVRHVSQTAVRARAHRLRRRDRQPILASIQPSPRRASRVRPTLSTLQGPPWTSSRRPS